MRSPAAAMAWQFGRQHRWGFLAIAAYFVALVAARGAHVKSHGDLGFAFGVTVPMAVMFIYALAVFSYGNAGDLAARTSIFPARMFTLPATSTALAGWPMLLGVVAAIAMWTGLRAFAPWPRGVSIPIVWPAALGAAILAWNQALMWLPYGFAGARVVIAVLWLTMIDTVAFLALQFHASEPVMLALLVPQVPLAFVVARYAVARARRGDVPDWSGLFAGTIGAESGGTRASRAFASAHRAQVWFEWKQYGRSLPALLALVLPFELLLLWVARDAAPLIFEIVIGALITPAILASFTAPSVGRAGSSFLATKPLTDAGLIAAKLETTLWSTALAWIFVAVAVPLALVWSDTWRVVSERLHALAGVIGTQHTAVFCVLVVVACVASTWRQLVQSLYIGLTGREWLVKGSVFVTLVLIIAFGVIAEWVIDRRLVGVLWSATPLILAVLVVVKMSAATWTMSRLQDARVMSDRSLVTFAAAWAGVVIAFFAVLVWLLASPLMANYLLMLIAILAVPLVRLAAAPLTLASSRHR